MLHVGFEGLRVGADYGTAAYLSFWSLLHSLSCVS